MYYGARYYDAGLGRWISADTIIDTTAGSQGLNRYMFTAGNPVMRADVDGHIAPIIVAMLIGAAIGAYAGGAAANGGNLNFTQWENNKETWQGIGIGALAGAVAGAVGFATAGVGLQGAMASGMYSGAAAGFINGAGHAWANGGSWQDVLMGGITGAITGGVTGAFAAGALFGVNKLASSGANSIFKDIPYPFYDNPLLEKAFDPHNTGNNFQLYSYGGAAAGTYFTSPMGTNTIQVNSPWGERTFNDRTEFHYAIDFDATQSGDPVYSIESGHIVDVGKTSNGTNYLILRGDISGQYLGYFHTKAHVSIGQWVPKGQQVGTIDLSGRSTGAHLHFTTQTSYGPLNKRSGRYNPKLYMDYFLPNIQLNY